MKNFIGFLFSMLAIAGTMTACEKDGLDAGGKGKNTDGLVLAVSRMNIKTDGVEVATLTVTYNGVSVTSQSEIMLDGNPLGGNKFRTTTAGVYRFTAKYDNKTSNEVIVTARGEGEQGVAPVLVVDKNTMVNDGVDMATFTVTLDGEDITRGVVIKVNNEAIQGNQWKSTATGRFKFVTEFDGKKSNEVQVTVSAAEVVISADKLQIWDNGMDVATFKVMYGATDVTTEAVITNGITVMEGNKSLTALEVGKRTYKATYKNLSSNALTVECVASPLALNPDKLWLAKGEKLSFTATRVDRDVTATCGVRLVGTTTDITSFQTDTGGEYEFYAYTKDNAGTTDYRESLPVRVYVNNGNAVTNVNFDAGRELYKNVNFLIYTRTGCTFCYFTKLDMASLAPEKHAHMTSVSIYDNVSDPKLKENDIFATIYYEGKTRFGTLDGFPHTIVQMDKDQGGYGSPFHNTWYEGQIGKPARTGIKVESTLGNSKVDFTVTVGAQVADTYYVAAMLVEDNITAQQYDTQAVLINNYVHQNVYRNKATSMFGDALGAMSAGATKSKSYSIAVREGWQKSQLSLVVYTLYDSGGKRIIANSVKVPVNGTTGYRYNE